MHIVIERAIAHFAIAQRFSSLRSLILLLARIKAMNRSHAHCKRHHPLLSAQRAAWYWRRAPHVSEFHILLIQHPSGRMQELLVLD